MAAEQIQQGKNRFNALKPEDWSGVVARLVANEEYRQFRTAKNLSLLLQEIGVPIDVTTDKVFALATNQMEWFEKLQREQEVK